MAARYGPAKGRAKQRFLRLVASVVKIYSMGTPQVRPQRTPNPNAMKFSLDRTVVEAGSRTISSAAAAQGDAVAEPLFAIPGVVAVFMVADFITVTKDAAAAWDDLTPSIVAAIVEAYS